jgi:putative ABC transport system ATP-binding protein
MGLSKSFGGGENEILVLRNLDLKIRMGHLTILMGPSGCGKTTLISIIAGLLDPNSGEVEVLGERPGTFNPRERILFRRDNLGFVFQQFNLLPALTAAENVAVPLLVAAVNRRQAQEKARHVLAALGMGDRSNALPAHLSGGQQQRVAMARALVHDPRLILCDEPTSTLDAKNGAKVMELLSEIALQPERAVIVVTHDNRVLDFADSIAHMEDGKIRRIEKRGCKCT